MDSYIPQFLWKKLIEDSIGNELIKYGYVFVKQSDRAYHYVNDKTELIIFYYHKEVGITIKNNDKSIYSNDIVSNCNKIY